MTLTLANEIRAAGTPVYCSACHNQDPSKRHVDFDAACDRGYGERDDGHLIAMDDLVICEVCLRAAALLVGMRDMVEVQAELESLRKVARNEHYRADAADRYADQLEEAISNRPVPVSAPRRRGRPPKDGIDES